MSPLAQLTPNLLLWIVTTGMTFILWQVAMLVQARRGARLLRWSLVLQLIAMVLEVPTAVARAAGHHTVAVVSAVISIGVSVPAMVLLLVGTALTITNTRPPRRRRRRRLAPAI